MGTRKKSQPVLRARDIMNSQAITVPTAMSIGDLADLFQRVHIHAAPVLDADGRLAGMVTQEDILYGTMGGEQEDDAAEAVESTGGLLEAAGLDSLAPESPEPWSRPVSDIMTEAAFWVEPSTPLTEVCRLMWSLRIHHLPVIDGEKVVGVISSLDFCRAVAEGMIRI